MRNNKIDLSLYEEYEDMLWEQDGEHHKEKLSNKSYNDNDLHTQTKQWREARQNGRGRMWHIDDA